MDVVLVRWPGEGDRLAQLRQEGRPRLLLVDSDAPPPLTGDALEDWIRVPAREADVRARIAVLSMRTGGNGTAEEPVLDDDGVLRFRGQWVSLPPVEARLTRALLERYGSVVSRETLTAAGWPGGAHGRNALDVHVLRLRRRLDPIGLAIRTVRSRGYLLEDGTQRAGQVHPSAGTR
ncbi:MAG TPA: winged helix-turn-helix domain-containing protein [Acidimicrobiales bacterium]